MPTRPVSTMVASTAIAIAIAAIPAHSNGQTACGTWTPLVEDLIGNIASGSVRERVSDLVVFDAGDGPMLYMAGNFEVVVDPVFGEVRAPGLARWDGERWSAVPGLDAPGLELDRRAIALEVFDDGSGPALYVGGEFSTAAGLEARRIARWDGTEWAALGTPGGPEVRNTVFDIHHHDFGDGPMLYVGGFFFEDASPPVQGLLRWDGTGWMEPGLAPPTGNAVYELASYGGDLFAAGAFMRIGEEQADGIARFDGTDWTTPLGPDQGIRPVRFWPLMPAVRDGRSVLVVGGWFMIDQGDDVIANRLAVWDGNMWTSLTPEPAVDVRDPASLIEFDDGLGEAVFVAGNNVAGSASVSRLRDGVLLPMPDPGFDVAVELFVFDDGSGPVLLVGGQADRDVIPPAFLVRWQPAAPCPADINSDCQLDLFDFLAFQDAFDDGDPRADIDGDGRLSVFDFLAFQNAFDAGCG